MKISGTSFAARCLLFFVALFALWSLGTVPTQAQSAVFINEVDADTPGADTLEFVELYDGGAGNTALDGLVLVLFNGGDNASYRSFDLDGKATDANGYFVLGNTAVFGVDLTFTNGTLQNGADAVALYQGNASDFPNNTPLTTANLLDAIVYDTNDPDDPGLLPLLNVGQPQLNEGGNGSASSESNQRCPNGSGGARNTNSYVQAIPTPGADNACPSAALNVNVVGNVGADAVTSAGGNPSPGPIDCPTALCVTAFDFNDAVTLNVTVDASSSFLGWSGDCAALGSSPSGVLTMDGAKNCTATFAVPAGTSDRVFVRSDGSDGNDCLKPATACATIQAGVNAVSSGGTVAVAAGRYGGGIAINKPLNLVCNPTLGSASACAVEGASGITINVNGVAISGFTFQKFGAGPAVSVTGGEASLHGNAFVGTPGAVGLNGVAAANDNWWGCNGGPSDTNGCTTTTGGANFDPWLVATLEATPDPATVGASTQITVDLSRNSEGQIVSNTLSRPTSLSTSDGTLSQNALPAVGMPRPSQRNGDLPSPTLWTLAALLLFAVLSDLIFGPLLRYRRWSVLAVVLLVTFLGGCGLLGRGGFQAVPQTVSITMVNGVASVTLSSPLPGDITVTVGIDRETLVRVVRFIVRPSTPETRRRTKTASTALAEGASVAV